MALSLEKFAASLVECGVLSTAELSAFRTQNNPADAEQLARGLVRGKLLTAYQAQQVYAGRAKALTMGNYLILDKLGQGGMGMVLKARHKRMNRIVALKVLSPTVVKTPEALARFHREVQAAAKLQHPNIVMAFDADEANSTHFLVMEYVEGADLSARIKKNGPLPLDQAMHHITQAARGLEFAHKHGVIHRDIKPANLLLDTDGTVKILDMGLARIEGETGANAELTSTGAVMGTVDYMAPEQALSTKTADARSDIYSLGITLWYLLTARPAYEGDSLMARLMAHANSTIPSLKAARADIPDGLDAVYQKMVAKKPTDRFQTMTEVLTALEACRTSATGDSRTIPGGSAGPSEDSKLSEMFALFGGGDSSAPTRTVTAAQKGTSPTRPSPGGEFEKTVTSVQPDADTDPTTLTSLRKSTGPQRKRRTAKPHWWQDIRVQVGGGLAALLLLVLAFVVTRGDPTTTSATPVGDKLASVVPSVATPRKSETASSPIPIASPPPEPSAAPRLSLAYDGTIRACARSLDVDRTKPFTIEAWTTPQAAFPNGTGVVFLSPACGLAILDDRWILRVEDLAIARQEKKIETNRRVHLAGVRSEKELILFVDGVVVARSPIPPRSVQERANFYMGRLGKYGYRGLIDEVRISSGVRYSKEFTPRDRFEADDQTIALYHFDEGRGSDIRDSSGNGYHGFVENEQYARVADPPWVRPDSDSAERPAATASGALWFDGLVSYVDIPTLKNIDSESITLEARVRPDGLNEHGAILSNAGDPKGGFRIKMNGLWGNRWDFIGVDAHGREWVDCTSSRPLELGKEVFLAGVWDGKMLMLFVNGVPVGSREVAKGLIPSDAGFKIGGAPRTGDAISPKVMFHGLIDEVRVSRGARYAATYTPKLRLDPDADTLALYHFDEGSGNEARDASGHGHHGKIVGAKWVTVATASVRPQSAMPPAVPLVSTSAPKVAVSPFDATQAKAYQATWAKHLGTEVETPNSVGATMVLIPPGEFLMGSTPEQVEAAVKIATVAGEKDDVIKLIRNGKDQPQHRVVLTKPFRMGATEVTVGQYKKFWATGYRTNAERTATDANAPNFFRSGNPEFVITDDLPVGRVTWEDAQAYCDWLSREENAIYRLPTDAEWEFACRAGTTTLYSFGDDVGRLSQFAWFGNNAERKPHPVATRIANPFGLFDMHGSVFEWCHDYYGDNWYATSPPIDPVGPPSGVRRVLRNGGAFNGATWSLSTHRGEKDPETLLLSCGFRVVRELMASP